MSMKKIAVVTMLAVGIVGSPVIADKPDPVNNPPLQVREANVDSDDWIAVHEQGVADVRVTEGQIDVVITNDGATAVPVVVQGNKKEVFNLQHSAFMAIGAISTIREDFYTVPLEKRLVITSASVDTGLNDCAFTLNTRIRFSGVSGVDFPLGAVSSSAHASYHQNQATYPVTLYAAPEEIIGVDFFRSDDSCVTLVRLNVTGYLEDNI